MLIVYAHPNKDGHCGCILKNVIKKVEELEIKYEVLDLYEMGFDPVLAPSEHYTSGHTEVADVTGSIQEKIKEHNNLIFIYPTWWQNMPAILKGFLDRVFIAGYAFVFEGKMPKALLKGKRAVIFTSTGGPRIFTKLFASDRSVKVLKTDTLKFCGIESKAYFLPSADKFTSKKEQKIQKLVFNGLKFL